MARQTTLERLTNLRNALLALHQALLDYQRVKYEKQHGRVASSGKFFHLVSNDSQFAWLRSLSELIVGLDSYLETAVFTTKNVSSLKRYTKKLLQVSKQTGIFQKAYFVAIQQDPVVLIAHRRVMQQLD